MKNFSLVVSVIGLAAAALPCAQANLLEYELPRECIGRPLFRVYQQSPSFFSQSQRKRNHVSFCHGLTIESEEGSHSVTFSYDDGAQEEVSAVLTLDLQWRSFSLDNVRSSEDNFLFHQCVGSQRMHILQNLVKSQREYFAYVGGDDDLCRGELKCSGLTEDWDEATGEIMFSFPPAITGGSKRTIGVTPLLTMSEYVRGKRASRQKKKIAFDTTAFPEEFRAR